MSVVQQTVYVTGLGDNVTEQDLVNHFSNIGPITQVFLVYDEASSRPSGTAYVVFSETQNVQKAETDLSGHKLKGKELTVEAVPEGQENELTGLIQEAKYKEMQELKERMSLLNPSDLQQLLLGIQQQPNRATHSATSESSPGQSTALRERQTSMNTQNFSASPQVIPSQMPRPDPGIRIPQFSGDGGKGELSYEQWKYEVNCLTTEGYSSSSILHAIRRSLRGTAADIVRYLGRQPTVDMILSRFDITFGNVLSTEQLFQEFYSTRQKSEESISAWSCRLQDLLSQLREQGSLGPEAATDMLRSKFWSGLSSPDVRNASRHKFDSGESYEGLVMYVRSLQFEVRPTENLKSKKSVVHQITSEETNKKIDQLCASFKDLKEDLRDIRDRVKSLESEKKSSSQEASQIEIEARPKPKYRKKLSVLCKRCGRRGHKQEKCYAKIHIDGSHLNTKAPSSQDGE